MMNYREQFITLMFSHWISMYEMLPWYPFRGVPDNCLKAISGNFKMLLQDFKSLFENQQYNYGNPEFNFRNLSAEYPLLLVRMNKNLDEIFSS